MNPHRLTVYTGLPGTGKSSALLHQLMTHPPQSNWAGFVTVRRIQNNFRTFVPVLATDLADILKGWKNLDPTQWQSCFDHFLRTDAQTCTNRHPVPVAIFKDLILEALSKANHEHGFLILDEVGGLELLDEIWLEQLLNGLQHTTEGIIVLKSKAHASCLVKRHQFSQSDLDRLNKAYDRLYHHLEQLPQSMICHRQGDR